MILKYTLLKKPEINIIIFVQISRWYGQHNNPSHRREIMSYFTPYRWWLYILFCLH